MRAVLSCDAVTMRLPSGLKAAESTRSSRRLSTPISSWPRRTAISLPLAASQVRAVLSFDVVTMRVPSELKSAEVSQLPWPPRLRCHLACDRATAS